MQFRGKMQKEAPPGFQEPRVLRLSAADHPAYQVCAQPDLSIYLFVDIGNPILWVFISFDYALIFNCFRTRSAFTPFSSGHHFNNNFCQGCRTFSSRSLCPFFFLYPSAANCLSFILQYHYHSFSFSAVPALFLIL